MTIQPSKNATQTGQYAKPGERSGAEYRRRAIERLEQETPRLREESRDAVARLQRIADRISR